MTISKTNRNQIHSHFANIDSKKRQKSQFNFQKISNLEVPESLHKLHSSNSTYANGLPPKKYSFSLSNHQTATLIAGIGISTLIFSLIYGSLHSAPTPSPSENLDSHADVCPSPWFFRHHHLDASIPSIPAHRLLCDSSSKYQELLPNSYQPFQPQLSDLSSLRPQVNKVLREVISWYQDRASHPPRLLLSYSDSLISTFPNQLNEAISHKRINLFPFQFKSIQKNQIQNPIILDRKSWLQLKTDSSGYFGFLPSFFNPFQTVHSDFSSLSSKSLSALTTVSSEQSKDLSQDFPRLSLSSFDFSVFNDPLNKSSTLIQPSQLSNQTISSKKCLAQDTQASPLFTEQLFHPPIQSNISSSIAICSPTFFNDSTKNISSKLSEDLTDQNIQQFVLKTFNSNTARLPNRANRPFRNRFKSILFSRENLQCFPPNTTNPEITNSSQKILPLLQNPDQKWIEDQSSFSLEFNSDPLIQNVDIDKTDLNISLNSTSAIISTATYVYQLVLGTFDSTSESIRAWLGIPKWFWGGVVVPFIYKPVKSMAIRLPLKRITTIAMPILTVSWIYGGNFIRFTYPILRPFIPRVRGLRDYLDKRFLEITRDAIPTPPPGEAPVFRRPAPIDVHKKTGDIYGSSLLY